MAQYMSTFRRMIEAMNKMKSACKRKRAFSPIRFPQKEPSSSKNARRRGGMKHHHVESYHDLDEPGPSIFNIKFSWPLKK